MAVNNMTDGSITKHLLAFAIPMIMGNLFQLTYNAVDSIIVGRFIGDKALASVGTANPVMNIVIFFIIGICTGASVLLSQFYGAGDMERFEKELSSTLLAGFVFSILITAFCLVLSKPILILLRTPDEILSDSVRYLNIIFIGLVFTFMYNFFASSLRSVGDSRTPLIFLIIASILNGVLDLFFIGYLKMGVLASAYTTVFAQAISAISCTIYIWHRVPVLKIKKEALTIDSELLKKTISFSWASAMQQTTLYIGKVLVQGAVNPLGVETIAAFNAVSRVDDFAFTPQQSIGAGITTFVAQNKGAGDDNRALKGLVKGLIIETIYGIIIGVLVCAFARPIMTLFISSDNRETLRLGALYLTLMAFFYMLPAYTNGIQGYFRGIGRMDITLLATATQMFFRVGSAYLLVPYTGFSGIALACLIGWMAMLIFEVPLLIKHIKEWRKTNERQRVRD